MKQKTLTKSRPKGLGRSRHITGSAATRLPQQRPAPLGAARHAEQWLHFLEYHPPARVSQNLRRMLMEFLMTDNGIEASYLKDLLYDLEGLFEVLEA